MSQRRQMVDALKRQLRARGMTYATLGKKIGLSEASVKRVFSRGTFTLERLEEICVALDTSLFQVARAAEATVVGDPTELTEKQERALAADIDLLSYFHLLLSGGAPKKLKNEKFLLVLDRLKLLELHSGGRFRLLVNRQVRWLPDGPLMRRYGRELREDFFSRPFNRPTDLLRFVPARLSAPSIAKLRARLRKLVDELEDLHALDAELPDLPLQEVALMVAFRPWTARPVEKLRAVADA